MKIRSLVSIDDFSKEEILKILDMAEGFEKQPVRKLLEGKVAATLFFEPSTRTRLSFESAINRLGGKIVGFSDSSKLECFKRRNTSRHDQDGEQLQRSDSNEASY